MSDLAVARSEKNGSDAFVVFNILQFTALALLSGTYLSAMFSEKLERMKTWFALMVSCLLYCISFLLLVGHQTGAIPSLSLCLFQAGLIYAAPPSVAAAGLAFVIELYLRLSTKLTNKTLDRRLITALLFLPAIVHQLIFWIAMFTGLSKQDTVQRDSQQMFCHIENDLPSIVTGVSVVVLVVMMILLELYTVYYLWRARSIFRDLRRRCQCGPIFPFALFVRVGIYTLLGGFAIIMVDILLNKNSAASHGTGTLDLLAVIPLSIAIVFGTQEDIVEVYKFWRQRSRPADPAVPVDIE
ncbi:hypothetical protein J3R30DRAFT_2573018 [Lentinula aciculospora]|uniref:Uncharacterized protein n=1 Tax=Lentinula aciculospora TaxID=153920 RepID=A0A9W9AD86_9AGAR|nr:hypothetical protein J3R30DRAFT_2573018 [Lentinula aciculospora]